MICNKRATSDNAVYFVDNYVFDNYVANIFNEDFPEQSRQQEILMFHNLAVCFGCYVRNICRTLCIDNSPGKHEYRMTIALIPSKKFSPAVSSNKTLLYQERVKNRT